MRHIRSLMADLGPNTKWTETVRDVQHIINTSAYARSGLTPFDVLFPSADPPQSLMTPQGLTAFRRSVEVSRAMQEAALGEGEEVTAQLEPDSYVLLERIGRVDKLQQKLRGPMLLVDPAEHPNTLTIRDLNMKKEMVVHAERLRKFLTQAPRHEVEAMAACEGEYYEVDSIVDHRVEIVRRHPVLKVRLHWRGYEAAEDTWQPFDSEIDELEALDTYQERMGVKDIFDEFRVW
ncbi:Chromo (CHRromatin Organization MOdifier) domain [Carpediemonas membranifera]|uniref:Chromo (CHRromatin Organization MOdifier) domain n=1 Tax=Carpediemonas membranifera TaxID=201153 RepID=A0A8J6DZ17_9EUKA|nr:Chromo (CHRromatin Organization MOdifier) domain [Carpediemonas membranifera]|eukprot:KAG9393024.1 Chromo (CHRromatin Organization MOdifier) domain [Carpediemonas membranifera]